MDLKKMSNEDLVSRVINTAFVSKNVIEAWDYIEHKDELLSRLSRLEELEKQVEGLKCCGNCIEYFIIAGSFYPICNCEKNKRVDINPYNKCDHWRYDTITADERRVK